MALWSAIDAAADKLAATLPAHRGLAWCVFGLAYVALALLIGTQKPLWYDEIVSLHICNLPSMRDVIGALKDGADANPPLFHVITRASLALFGEGPIALRLPAIVGFAVFCWSLFRFASKRVPDSAAWSGVGAVFTTSAFYYVTEARPYGLVLGFSGLALICWQSAAEGTRRGLSIVGMTFCCAAALSCHYYGVLIIPPLFVAEMVRWRASGRLDTPVLAGILGSLLPLAFYVPLMTSAASYGHSAETTPSIGSILHIYSGLLAEGALLFVGLLALAMIWRQVPSRLEQPAGQDSASERSLLPHEATAVGMLCLTPLVALGCGYVTGVFVDRYAIVTTFGFGLLFSTSVAYLSERRCVMGVYALVLVVGVFFAKEHFLIIRSLRGQEASRPIPQVLLRAAHEGDVVIANPAACPQYLYYTPPELREKVYCVVDPVRAARLTSNASPGTGLVRLREWAPIQVEDYDDFLASHSEFLLFHTVAGEHFAWLLTELSRDEQVSVRLVARARGESLYHVQRK